MDKNRNRPPTKNMPWHGDPLGDVANAYAIPADHGTCLLCFGDKEIGVLGYGKPGKSKPCSLCKGTGIQTPELVWNYRKGDNILDQLQGLA